MKFKKLCSTGLICILSVMMLVGCSSSAEDVKKEDKGKEITALYMFNANNLNPHVSPEYMPVVAGVVETLTKIDKDLKVKPWLMESYTTKDAKNWEFKIRDGVKFSSGTVLDAAMVKSNLEAVCAQNPGIKNALNIESMDADGQILKIVTKEAEPALLSELAHPNTGIIDMNVDNKDSSPIGTGPFVVEKFTPNSSLDLSKNENYWDGDVKLDKVNFGFNDDANARIQALQSGYADIIYRIPGESIASLKKDSNITVKSEDSLRVNEIIYNVAKEDLKNKEIRKGIDALINRQEIVDKVMFGQGSVTYGPVHKQTPFAIDFKENPYGVEKALEHFKNAGLEVVDGKVYKNKKPLSLKIVTYANRPELPAIAQVIESTATKVGINMEIEIVENIDEHLSTHSDWDLCVYSMITNPRGDAGYLLNGSYMVDSISNHGKINDAKLIDTINKFNECPNEAQRNDLAKDALTIINDENYISYLAFSNITVAYNNRISNLDVSKYEFYTINKDVDVK